MRVKLSYSVEEGDVLAEAAKMLNLSADQLQEAIQLFQESQQELGKTGETDDPPNLEVVLEKLDDLRKCLLAVDTRAAEVGSVVVAYDDYRREQRSPSPPDPKESEESDLDDNLGAD
tara:strand:- start:1309 stop:1659 length:351 start_codon:yes stop_codon:yes gene_type:complete